MAGQSKQDGLSRLISLLIVIDLLSFLQTGAREYLYHFTVKELLFPRTDSVQQK